MTDKERPVTKQFVIPGQELELKAEGDEMGYIKCVFATLEVEDKHGDVIMPGAIGAGEALISPMQHMLWNGVNAVGAGNFYEKDGKAIMEGRFNLNTQNGRETYECIKFSPQLYQFSFGFNIIEEKPGRHGGRNVYFIQKTVVYEVSPVVVGAGVNTGVLEVKSEDTDVLETKSDEGLILPRPELVLALHEVAKWKR